MSHVEDAPLATVATSGRPRGVGLGRRIVSTVVLLPAFLGLVVLAPAWAFTVLVLVVGLIGQWEFLRMFRRAGVRPFVPVGLVGGLLMTGAFATAAALPGVVTGLVLVALGGVLVQRRGTTLAWEPAAVTLLGIFYVNWLLGHAIWLRSLPVGTEWVLLLVWVTWVGETVAYLVGSTVGRRPLAPRVSPRKTVEGALAQLVVSPVAALAAQGWLGPPLGGGEAVLIGLLLGVVGQAGDLVESLLKRSVGTKDTGQIIPGHGGLLDRVDGLLFNAPVLFYYAAHARALWA